LKPIAKHIIHPFKKPWDFVFGKKEAYWVIVHLKDKRKIGGKFAKNSFASSYPSEEQIYLEEVWTLDENGKFKEPLKRSGGIIILGKEILAVEFFRNKNRRCYNARKEKGNRKECAIRRRASAN